MNDIAINDKELLTVVNEILYRICKDKDHLYFISGLEIHVKDSKMKFDLEWGEMTKIPVEQSNE